MNTKHDKARPFLQVGANNAECYVASVNISSSGCGCGSANNAAPQTGSCDSTAPSSRCGSTSSNASCCGGGCGSTPVTQYLQIERSKNEPAEQVPQPEPLPPQSAQTKLLAFSACAVSGAVLALSSPGLDQSYIAWFGLVPLLFATFTSRTILQSFNRAFVFGASYTLAYGHWLLTLHPAWAWVSPEYIGITAAFWWIICAIHQGIVFGAIAAIIRKLPLSCGWFPEFNNGVKLPILVIFPILWVLMLNKVANCPATLGFPWTMLEYSQYRNLELLQVAKFIGGIGIGALIVLANTAIFTTAVNLFPKLSCSLPPMKSRFSAIMSSLWVVLLIVGFLNFGQATLNRDAKSPPKTIPVSLLQGNLSGKADGSRPVEIISRYLELSAQAPHGLCIWTEWVLPINLAKTNDKTIEGLITLAKLQGQSWLLGALEKDQNGNTYNAVCALTSDGKMVETVYRKRFLVPFLEHLPDWVSKTPLKNVVSTLAPGEVDLQPGISANVMKLPDAKVGSLICLEVVQPELVNESVRDGAEILADLSNTSWYSSPLPGRQMIAFSVLRAVETSRAVLFSTTIGPSAIIAPNGRIIAETQPRTTAVLKKEVPVSSEITPFVRWFR